MKTNRRAILISLSFAALFYLGLTLWSNALELKNALAQTRFIYLPLIFLLTLTSYAIRFGNWQFYLHSLGINLPNRYHSWLIFISGFSLTITPGKLGEVIRSYLLKEAYQVPISKTGSLVLVDRLTDLLALVFIAGIGAMHYQYGGQVLFIVLLAISSLIIIITWRSLAEKIIRALGRFRFINKRLDKAFNLYQSSYELLIPKRLFIILLISIAAWSLEAVGFFLTFKALGLESNIFTAWFIYAFSTILGAVSMLPGGLGMAEGTMTALLVLANLGKATATAATLIIRAATLWFSVILGSISLWQFQKILPKQIK